MTETDSRERLVMHTSIPSMELYSLA